MSKAYNSHSSGYNFKLFKLLDIGEKMEKWPINKIQGKNKT
jgi:hypothetical protein